MKKPQIIPLALSASLLLTGCEGSIYSNYRQTETLELVEALGVDMAGEGETMLSVSCAAPSGDSRGAIISLAGSSIPEAMAHLQQYSADRQLYYSHTEYLILGEDYARQDAGNIFDFIARDNQLRLGLWLFVVRGGDARELVTGPGEESYEIAKTLSSVRRDTGDQGGSHVFTARETLRELSENGSALVCALQAGDTEDVVFLAEPGVTALASGYGILKDGLLVDFVEPEISQAANLMLGKLGSAGPSLPDGRGGSLSLEYEGGGVKLRPRWEEGGGTVSIAVEAELRANLAEPDTELQQVTDRQLMAELEEALARDMEEKLEALLEQSRRLNADFLGLGAVLRGDDAGKAARLPEDWLSTAGFEVSCRAKILSTRELGDKLE